MTEQHPNGSSEEWTCPICQHQQELYLPKPTKFHFKILHIRLGAHLEAPPWWIGHEKSQERFAKRLESHRLHIAIIVLTLIDLCLVLTGLVLLAIHGTELPHGAEKAEEALAYGSIAILSVFTIEQMCRVVVFGLRYFLNVWHLIDAVVVITSLILEILLRGPARDAVAVLVVFRLWRLVRVIHGVGSAMAMEHQALMEKHHKFMKKLEKQVQVLKIEVRECGGDESKAAEAAVDNGGGELEEEVNSGNDAADAELERVVTVQEIHHS